VIIIQDCPGVNTLVAAPSINSALLGSMVIVPVPVLMIPTEKPLAKVAAAVKDTLNVPEHKITSPRSPTTEQQ